MPPSKFALVLIAGLAACGAAGHALAADSENSERTLLQSTHVTLTQAIATAERQTGGRAYDAGVDGEHGAPRIVVETQGPSGTRTVYVDAATEIVTGSHEGGEAD